MDDKKFTLRLPAHLYEKLSIESKENCISVSCIIKIAIIEYFKKKEKGA